jgi:hypothetical protein
MAEERKGISLKCCKIVESCKDRGEDDNTCHNCYVVWYEIIKTRSWVSTFALSLECPVLNASIESFLHIMSFDHHTNYFMTMTEVEKAKVNKMLYLIQERLFFIAMRAFLINLI